MSVANPRTPKEAQQRIARLRADLVRLRVKLNTLTGRVSGSAAVEGSRSGGLGKQRKQGGQNPSLRSFQQEQETLTRQIAAVQGSIATLESWLAEQGEAEPRTESQEPSVES